MVHVQGVFGEKFVFCEDLAGGCGVWERMFCLQRREGPMALDTRVCGILRMSRRDEAQQIGLQIFFSERGGRVADVARRRLSSVEGNGT
jgi:hypothetical protein